MFRGEESGGQTEAGPGHSGFWTTTSAISYLLVVRGNKYSSTSGGPEAVLAVWWPI